MRPPLSGWAFAPRCLFGNGDVGKASARHGRTAPTDSSSSSFSGCPPPRWAFNRQPLRLSPRLTTADGPRRISSNSACCTARWRLPRGRSTAGPGTAGPRDLRRIHRRTDTRPFRCTPRGRRRAGGRSGPHGPVDRIRQAYQACEYDALASALPGAIAVARATTEELTGHSLDVARSAAADALHTAAGLLLRCGRQDLALVAADRAVGIARASGNPLTEASAQRSLVHACMTGGSPGPAAHLAETSADRLPFTPARTHRAEPRSPRYEALCCFAVLSPQREPKTEGSRTRSSMRPRRWAESSGTCSAVTATFQWTAFGPVNVAIHRVSIAVELGDAGQALALARTIDAGGTAVLERRTTLAIEIARACAMSANQRSRSRPSLPRSVSRRKSCVFVPAFACWWVSCLRRPRATPQPRALGWRRGSASPHD